MSRWIPICAAVAMLAGLLPATAEAAEDAGKATFLASGCNRCHPVAKAGIPRADDEETAEEDESRRSAPDLSKVGPREKTFLRDYLRGRVLLDKKRHPTRYRGTAEHLDLVVDWLMTVASTPKK